MVKKSFSFVLLLACLAQCNRQDTDGTPQGDGKESNTSASNDSIAQATLPESVSENTQTAVTHSTSNPNSNSNSNSTSTPNSNDNSVQNKIPVTPSVTPFPAEITPVSGNNGAEKSPNTYNFDPIIPVAVGACPVWRNGDTEIISNTGKTRKMKVYFKADFLEKDRPLILFWHGWGDSPEQAEAALGGKQFIDEITKQGTVIVAPYSEKKTGMPWYLTLNSGDSDLLFADKIVACAIAQLNVNSRRIHSVGFSAGGLHNASMMFLRNNYLATAVLYSGGILPMAKMSSPERTENHLPTLLYHGGVTDLEFQNNTLRFSKNLVELKYPHVLCNHGGGHFPPNITETEKVARWILERHFGEDSHKLETMVSSLCLLK